jgi:hypothetical protein
MRGTSYQNYMSCHHRNSEHRRFIYQLFLSSNESLIINFLKTLSSSCNLMSTFSFNKVSATMILLINKIMECFLYRDIARHDTNFVRFYCRIQFILMITILLLFSLISFCYLLFNITTMLFLTEVKNEVVRVIGETCLTNIY